MVSLEGGCKYDPEMKCPACNCLHAGGIRCYLNAKENDLYLSVFVRPFGKTLLRVLRAKQVVKEGGLLGFGSGGGAAMSDDEEK
jgi:hypothetical protein